MEEKSATTCSGFRFGIAYASQWLRVAAAFINFFSVATIATGFAWWTYNRMWNWRRERYSRLFSSDYIYSVSYFVRAIRALYMMGACCSTLRSGIVHCVHCMRQLPSSFCECSREISCVFKFFSGREKQSRMNKYCYAASEPANRTF